MKDPPLDAIDALCLAAAPQRANRRDLEAELTRQRLLARVAGRDSDACARLGRFEVLRCIGRGGMGTVFEARDPRGAPVALKVLHDASDQALARLKREFRALRDVGHPHLVAMYELYLEQGLPFFTMELIDGPSLGQLLAPGAALDLSFVARVVHALYEALTAIHARGTFHGDIKPSNILVPRSGPLVLVDFGVACSLGNVRTTCSSGTPAYMAPERLYGLPPDAASDWYALGAVLHELLASVSSASSGPDAERLRALHALSAGLQEPEPQLRFGAREVAKLGVGGPRPGAPWPQSEAAFVGRESELAQLEQALAAVVDRPEVCVVSGEAGIGKTALVERFLVRAEPRVLALRGRCYEDEALPYKGIEGVVEELAAQLESMPNPSALRPADAACLLQVFPALQRVWREIPSAARAPEQPRRVRQLAFVALSELLANVARARPLVLFVDDLQWGDADGALLLRHLLSEPSAPALLFIGSYRSDGEGPCVAALRAAATRPAQLLAPLAPEACRDLLRDLLGARHDPRRHERVLKEAGGSPLLLQALLRVGSAPDGGERDYAQLIAGLLDELPAGAHELLALVSLAGCPLDLDLAGDAAELAGQPRKWLPSLRAQRLLRSVARESGLALLPHHDRVREVVLATLEPEARRRYHARLAAAAARVGRDEPEFSAHHHFRAHELAAAAPHAERAGDRARAAMALERARELYERALACRAPERPPSLIEKLADVAAAAGDLQRAAPLFLEAVAAQPTHDWRLRLRAAEIYLLRGAAAEGMALLRPAMREAGIPVPANMAHALLVAARSLARCHLSRRSESTDADEDLRAELSFRIGYMVTLHDAKGVALLLWSAARALRHGSGPQRGRALATLAHVHSLLGLSSAAEQDALLERALTLTRGAPLAHAAALACQALVAFGRSQCDVALASIERVNALVGEHPLDAQWMLAHVTALVASVSVLAGDFERIRRFAPSAEQVALEQGNRPVLTQVQSARAWASLAAGEPDAMQRYAAAARDEWRAARLSPLYGIAVWGECHRLLYLADTDAAQALMRLEAPRFARAGLTRTQAWRIPLAQLWGSVALACAERPGDAHFRAAERHAQRLAREPSSWGQACAALLYAGLARRAERSDHAKQAYRDALRAFAQLGMHGFAAVAAYRARQIDEEHAPRALLDWFAAQRVADADSWVRMLAP